MPDKLLKITPAQHRVMPWKNGLGTTREIAIDPPGAAMTDTGFRWRLSIADVAQSGPFSMFPGIDRTIMVIKGNGMVLSVAGQPPRRLDKRFVPYGFSGDPATECELIDGPIQDFNLMVNRALLSAQVEVREVLNAEPIPFVGDTCILHLLAGQATFRWRSSQQHVNAGDTIVLSNAAQRMDGMGLDQVPASAVVLAVIGIETKQGISDYR